MPLKTALREKREVEEIVLSYICDKCGKTKPVSNGHPPGGFHTLTVSGGWGCTYPGDMGTIRIVVCCQCLEAWGDTFMHPATVLHDPMSGASVGPFPATVACRQDDPKLLDGDARTVYPDMGVCTVPGHTLEELNVPDIEVPDDIWPWRLYTHYKGGRYVVHGLVWDAKTDTVLVHYQPLSGDSLRFLRPYGEWDQEVEDETGEKVIRFLPDGTPE